MATKAEVHFALKAGVIDVSSAGWFSASVAFGQGVYKCMKLDWRVCHRKDSLKRNRRSLESREKLKKEKGSYLAKA